MKKIEINYNEIDITVVGFYECGEPEVMYDSDLCGSPESPSEFDIRKVYVEDTNIMGLLTDETIKEIEDLVILSIEG